MPLLQGLRINKALLAVLLALQARPASVTIHHLWAVGEELEVQGQVQGLHLLVACSILLHQAGFRQAKAFHLLAPDLGTTTLTLLGLVVLLVALPEALPSVLQLLTTVQAQITRVLMVVRLLSAVPTTRNLLRLGNKPEHQNQRVVARLKRMHHSLLSSQSLQLRK
jgi:hypothetical protein